MWHCPHCGAPQAETARCWVCHRSSTTCSTCVHFRGALSADLGYCSFDPKRRPLTGREQRGCWEGRPIAAPGPKPVPVIPLHRLRAGPSRLAAADPLDAPTPAHREFVPLETMAPAPIDASTDESQPEPPTAGVIAESDVEWSERTSLFGDAAG